MVYASDFYTTRRPYRSTPTYSTYTVSKREIPWEKVPFVPRPSLVPDPVTAFGKKKAPHVVEARRQAQIEQRKSILTPSEREKIKPKMLLEPVKPYMSARDLTREKVLNSIRKQEGSSYSDSIDTVLPRLHKVAENPNLPYKRRIVALSDMPPIY